MYKSGFDNMKDGLEDIHQIFYGIVAVNPRDKAIALIDRKLVECLAALKAANLYRDAADAVKNVYGTLYREARIRLDESIDHTEGFWAAAASHQEAYTLLRLASLDVLTAEREYDIASSRYFMLSKLLEDLTADDESENTDE